MEPRETVIGIVVLGCVLGGVYWARARSHERVVPAASSAAATRAATTDSGNDVTQRDATVESGEGVRVTLSLAPRPPVAFAPLQVRARVEPAGALVEDARVAFEMDMPMGEHRYQLTPREDGWFDAEVLLPMCASGNPRWYAIVDATVAGRRVRARFQLDLARPR